MLKFKEFVLLKEAGLKPGVDPKVNQTITQSVRDLGSTQQGKDMDAPDLINTGVKDAVMMNKVSPGDAIDALKKTGAKTMKKTMKKR